MGIPHQLLRQLYTFASLRNEAGGCSFELKNRLIDVHVTRVRALRIDRSERALDSIRVVREDGTWLAADALGEGLAFRARDKLRLFVAGPPLEVGPHELGLEADTREFGALDLEVEDVIGRERAAERPRIPHRDADDLTPELVKARQRFVEETTGVKLEHLTGYSFDPAVVRGNIENFTGVAQVPIGFAGPIRIDGEHAKGDFLIPLATTEGTLVASYSRGIKVLNLAGGVKCTVSSDAMQRAPVFIFESAREARDFARFIDDHLDGIRQAAEATSHVAKLLYVDTYLSNKFAYLRFNFSTGDAAGQNMVGRATFAACEWILAHASNAANIKGFYLEANLATDKKHSHVNIMHTRGKRVTAEATIARDLLVEHLRVTPEALHYHSQLGTIGAILAGASNNGAHSPNGITAMFIATGQDVANVAESSAGILYCEVTPKGDFYLSLTIPSLIVATHGGGTALPTQRECLRILGCTERGSVNKLAEIVAGVALAGELSLGAAISSLDWVSSHEKMGRHR